MINGSIIVELLDDGDCLVCLRIVHNNCVALGILVCAFDCRIAKLVYSDNLWRSIQLNVDSVCVIFNSHLGDGVCTTFNTCEGCHSRSSSCLILIDSCTLIRGAAQFKCNTFYCSIVIVVLLENCHVVKRFIVYNRCLAGFCPDKISIAFCKRNSDVSRIINNCFVFVVV